MFTILYFFWLNCAVRAKFKFHKRSRTKARHRCCRVRIININAFPIKYTRCKAHTKQISTTKSEKRINISNSKLNMNNISDLCAYGVLSVFLLMCGGLHIQSKYISEIYAESLISLINFVFCWILRASHTNQIKRSSCKIRNINDNPKRLIFVSVQIVWLEPYRVKKQTFG